MDRVRGWIWGVVDNYPVSYSVGLLVVAALLGVWLGAMA